MDVAGSGDAGDRRPTAFPGHGQGYAGVQLGVRHRGDGGRAAGRCRVRRVGPPQQHDGVRGLPVRRLGLAHVPHSRVDAVRGPRAPRRRRGRPVRHHTELRRRNSRAPLERRVFFLKSICSIVLLITDSKRVLDTLIKLIKSVAH